MIQLKHLLKTVIRYKLSSGLTLLSLVVAFLGIIMLTLYTSYEYSFDRFHKNRDNIYMLTYNGNTYWVPALTKYEIKNELPDIENAIVISPWWQSLIYKPSSSIKEAIAFKGLALSTDFFKMFDFPLLLGDPETVLSQPKSVVISQELARKVFGDDNPIGETVTLSYVENYTITGVMQDMPQNSAFHSDAIISFETFMQPGNDFRGAQQWSEWSFHIFLQFNKNTPKPSAEEMLSSVTVISERLEYMKQHDPNLGFIELLPLKDLHFTSGLFLPYVNKKVVDVLIMLSVILVIMGIVNFINFSTSQAPLRAKSLSIQQILGEKKWRSKFQIIGESVLLALVALTVSLLIHNAIHIELESFFGIKGIGFEGRYTLLLQLAAFAVLFGVIAGWYPSRYITSPPVSQAVKGKMYFSGKGKGFRQVLITVQFVFTIAMIVAALTIEKQLNFWKNFDIGIDKENVVYINTSNRLRQSHQSLADELMKHSEISDYTYTQFLPGQVGMGWGREVDGKRVQLKSWPIDDRFFNFFGIQISEGRKFMAGEGDINNFILNEKAVQVFGWEKPLEKRFPGFDFEGDIIGIAKDFNFSSLKEEIEPMTFWLTNTRKNVLMLRAKTGNYTQLMRFIKETIQQFDADYDAQPRFLDDSLNRLYEKEAKLARFIEFVALWCVLLALTGLLGLTIFMSRDRIKEIGIRKVNGATAFEIVKMLNRSIATWVAVAFVIATPIAYYAMDKWLQNFAYRTQLSWWVFALAGLLALVIALLTVSWQSWLAARRNPVEALRYE
jgi:putative ABC transport system permease protein